MKTMTLMQFLSRASCLGGCYDLVGSYKGLNTRIRHIFIFGVATCLTFMIVVYYFTFPYSPPEIPVNEQAPIKYDGKTRPKYYQWETTSEFRPVSQDTSKTSPTAEELCRSFPNHLLDRMIQPVLKMGHNEARDKVEGQLDSVSACIKDLLIFSDLDETLHGHDVIDILVDMPATFHFENDDFVNYTRIRQQHRNSRGNNGSAPSNETWTLDGWRLDKYKFLPMVEKAWTMRPDKRWYFFYETDTYVVWDNVFRFLTNLDHDQPHYIGSPSPGRREDGDDPDTTTFFANGGPGFALSRDAVKRLLHRESGRDGDFIEAPLTQRWLNSVKDDCCGDSVLGWVLHSVDIDLSGYWPLFNPHSLHGVPFSGTYWCQPVLTMHKTKPDDMRKLWRWEHSHRISDRPLLYEDLYKFHHENRDLTLRDWDNCCWDEYPGPVVSSFEECEIACTHDKDCVQYRYHLTGCMFMRSIRYGEAREAEIPSYAADPEWKWNTEESRYMSGWSQVRIDEWTEKHRCTEIEWVRPSLKRIF